MTTLVIWVLSETALELVSVQVVWEVVPEDTGKGVGE